MLNGYVRDPASRHFGYVMNLSGSMKYCTLVQALDGEQSIILQCGGHYSQVRCYGSPASINPFVLELVVDDPRRYVTFSKRLAQFSSCLTGVMSDRRPKKAGARQVFHRDTLFVLDRKQVGFSDRETAAALYGEQAIDAEWGDRDGPLRARLRRLVAAGKTMRDSGYKNLLH